MSYSTLKGPKFESALILQQEHDVDDPKQRGLSNKSARELSNLLSEHQCVPAFAFPDGLGVKQQPGKQIS